MAQTHLAALIGTARPNFLLLTPACVFVGLAAVWDQPLGPADFSLLPLVLIGALLAHISVNMLNEYEDFRSGLDAQTVRTPFSGGSGTLPGAPDGAFVTCVAGWAALVGVLCIGAGLAYLRGPGLIPLGLLGALVITGYSTHIVRSPTASLVAPGLGFGPLMVMGTAFVLTGQYTAEAVVAALVPFFLVSNLLLVNQFPDVEADRRVGRSNLPIRIGRRRSAIVYAAFLLGAFGAIVIGIAATALPLGAALALVPALGAPILARGVYRFADDIERLEPYLGGNVVLTLVTIVLLGIGLLIG